MRSRKIQLTKESTEEEIGRVLDSIRIGESPKSLLIELLSERHAVYDGRTGYQMNRIRGYAMASFAEVGLPDSAINFVLDELQNGRSAYMIAAAARALRGSKRPKAEYAGFLIQAVNNLRYHDDSLDLTAFKPVWPLRHPSNAKLEIFRTLQWLRGYAKAILPELQGFLKNTIDFAPEIRQEIQMTITAIESDDRELDLNCCEIEGKTTTGVSRLWKSKRTISSIGNLEVQNQDEKWMSLNEMIGQKPTAIAFFYTRCMNPNKCTLTINKMAWLQKELIQKGLEDKVNLIAFTYDPGHDTATKLRVFGENRGIVFEPNIQLVRTRPEDFAALSDFFELGVNHVASTVNQHRLELYLLNQNGNIATTYTRLQWEVAKVANDLTKLVDQSSKHNWGLKITNTVQQVVFPVLVAFFPKCPFCWAAYLSALGISGTQSIPFSPWIAPVMMAIMIFNLVLLYRKSKVRNGRIPFWISLTGTVMVGLGYLFSVQLMAIPGIVLIFISALLNSLSSKNWSKLCFLIRSKWNALAEARLSRKIEI